jgi:hypothetical protein
MRPWHCAVTRDGAREKLPGHETYTAFPGRGQSFNSSEQAWTGEQAPFEEVSKIRRDATFVNLEKRAGNPQIRVPLAR